jgi:hypothetical protein
MKDSGAETLERVARGLVGGPVEQLRQVGGGRNSRVHRVDAASGTFALKQYPSLEDDPRDRLGAEVGALEWMAENGFAMVPRIVAVDRARNFVLLNWVEGEQVRDVGLEDIDSSLAFLSRLHELRAGATVPTSRLAAEACLSGAEIDRQLRGRVRQLLAIEGETALRNFLQSALSPALEDGVKRAREDAAGQSFAFERELGQGHRSLAPADFGFHNALRGHDGRLTFIDFEYFGWDDPVKLTADVLLHPGAALCEPARRRFRQGAERIYGSDPMFAERLRAFYPLFGLRWVLILLNEFHPERWRRRVLAGAADEWSDAKARQLRAAQDLLARLAG